MLSSSGDDDSGVSDGRCVLFASATVEGPKGAVDISNWLQWLFVRCYGKASDGGDIRRQHAESFFKVGDVMHSDFSGVGGYDMVKRFFL